MQASEVVKISIRITLFNSVLLYFGMLENAEKAHFEYPCAKHEFYKPFRYCECLNLAALETLRRVSEVRKRRIPCWKYKLAQPCSVFRRFMHFWNTKCCSATRLSHGLLDNGGGKRVLDKLEYEVKWTLTNFEYE